MGILIQGGRVVDAASQMDKIADVYLDGCVIQEIGEKLKVKDHRCQRNGGNARTGGSACAFP